MDVPNYEKITLGAFLCCLLCAVATVLTQQIKTLFSKKFMVNSLLLLLTFIGHEELGMLFWLLFTLVLNFTR